MKQQTLKRTVEFSGEGLHSGNLVRLELEPKPAGFGIQFVRSDLSPAPFIPAHVSNIVSTTLCTHIADSQDPKNGIATVEHLMAALWACEIDNVLVKVRGPEVPIMDGSAKVFIDGIMGVGCKTQSAPRKVFVAESEFSFKLGDSEISIKPAREFSLNVQVDYGSGSFIGSQELNLSHLNSQNIKRIMRSRTFCHEREIEALRQQGLARGGSLENAVVVTESGILNKDGLRDEKEFVMHKALDFIGDFYLLGAPIIGEVTLKRPGHTLHAQAMRDIAADFHRYFGVEFDRQTFRNPAEFPFVGSLSQVAFG